MIVFCEDCGAKNKLNASQIKSKKLSFTCLACSYKNNYKPGFSNQTATISFKTALGAIIESSLISDFFIFDKTDGIIENYMPEQLKETDLTFLANHVISSHEDTLLIFPDSIQTQWEIGKKYVTIRKLNATRFIIIAGSTRSLPPEACNHLNLLRKSFN